MSLLQDISSDNLWLDLNTAILMEFAIEISNQKISFLINILLLRLQTLVSQLQLKEEMEVENLRLTLEL